jgi:hypothetical protein
MGTKLNRTQPTDINQSFGNILRTKNSAVIRNLIDVAFVDFKNDIFNRVLKYFPCSSMDFDRILSNVYNTHADKFNKSLSRDELLEIEIEKGVKLFKLKCKAQEGYLRYYNDHLSLKVCFMVKKRVIDEFINEGSGEKALLNKYYKLVKGTYSLQGMEELKKLFLLKNQNIYEELEKQQQENHNKLKIIYYDIVNFEVVDSDIYRSTVQAVQDCFDDVKLKRHSTQTAI